MIRILAISDIHGFTEGTKILLDRANYQPGLDQLILLGDYIDYDYKTWNELYFVIELLANGAKAVLGNMEQWLLSQRKKIWFPSSYNVNMDFLEELPFYILYDKYLFVHAGIRPRIPLDKQLQSDLTGIRQDFWNNEEISPYFIVFGHTPTHKMGALPGELWHGSGKLGIDTGAKHGLRLTLVDLTNKLSYSISTAKNNLYGDFRIAKW